MDNYVMAINGAFFTTRRAGYTPSQYQIENAKNFVANAHYLFLEAAGNTLEQIASNLDAQEVAYNMFELEHVKNQLVSISIDMLRQANRAISTGIQNKAIELLGKNNAHGAMGLLVQKKMAELEITATDSAGRKWREPSSLVKTIVRWIEYPLSFVNGVPVGLGDSRTLTTQLDANASAISSLSNTVTQQGKDIASHSSSITSLNNSITNINGTLATKADSSALTNLANRVTTTEGAITSQGSSITSLNASVNGLLKDVAVSDTRSTNQPPSWYWSNYPLRIVREFKQASVLGLTGMGTYVSLETYVYWTDASGGPIIQIARGTDSKLTAERRSTSTSTWGSWTQDIKTLTDGLANKAEASALSSLDAKVSTIDGKVSTQATSITNLQTTVGGHTASIQSQQQSIDGLKSRATLKLQSGNLIGGVGIENDSKTVDFIIQANKFAIAPPSDAAAGSVAPKYAFVYQPTATTLPNGTVVPAGLYLDNASIGYINAEKINASSLSALSATLGTITTYRDPSRPNGARMVLTGSLITVYDDNNTVRVRLGLW
ncbi:hypothetical protein BFR96_12110 [Acinetobacter pittii]|nr:hypothetical protein BFR96_12110 [Acinetobacter pittii]